MFSKLQRSYSLPGTTHTYLLFKFNKQKETFKQTELLLSKAESVDTRISKQCSIIIELNNNKKELAPTLTALHKISLLLHKSKYYNFKQLCEEKLEQLKYTTVWRKYRVAEQLNTLLNINDCSNAHELVVDKKISIAKMEEQMKIENNIFAQLNSIPERDEPIQMVIDFEDEISDRIQSLRIGIDKKRDIPPKLYLELCKWFQPTENQNKKANVLKSSLNTDEKLLLKEVKKIKTEMLDKYAPK